MSLKLRLCLPCASSPVFLPSILAIPLIDLIPLGPVRSLYDAQEGGLIDQGLVFTASYLFRIGRLTNSKITLNASFRRISG